MQIQGKVIAILPEQSGEGKNGTWKKNKFVIETQGQYPKKVAIDVWGEKFYNYNLTVGDDVTAHLDLESREYNGKWYSDIKAWKVEKGMGTQAAPQQSYDQPFYEQPQTAPAQPTATPAPPNMGQVPVGNEPPAYDDDLPF